MTGVMNNSDAINGINQLRDYSYITERGGTGLLANCISAFGPINSYDNSILGGWYHHSRQVAEQGCSDGVKVIDSEYPGIRRMQQCGPFTAVAEGIYLCEMFDRSFVQHSMRLGVYCSGRSKQLVSYMLQ